MKSKQLNSRQLAEQLARAANIQPEPETLSLGDKIARVKADQTRLAGRSPVRLRRTGESNLVAKRRGLQTGSPIHRAICENYYWRSIAAPRWEQVIVLEMLYRE
jgi:hypothetical protein